MENYDFKNKEILNENAIVCQFIHNEIHLMIDKL